MINIGSNFEKGERRIGRRRLPTGFVAIIADPPLLAAALSELHACAIRHVGQSPDPCGIFFHPVSAQESKDFGYRIIKLRGMDWFNQNHGRFAVHESFCHAIDIMALIHTQKRHADPGIEQERGLLPITLADVRRIPEVVISRYAAEFSEARNMPRIVYRRSYDDGVLVAVEEIRHRRQELVLVTLYKQQGP